MLANIAQRTARRVWRALIISFDCVAEIMLPKFMDGYSRANQERIAGKILRRNSSEQYCFSGLRRRSASAEISGTRQDGRRKRDRARPAWNKTSHPRPAPAATPGRESNRAPRQMCTPRFDTQDVSPP